MHRMMTRRHAVFGLALTGAGATSRLAGAQTAEEPDPWPELVRMFFDGKPIVEDGSMILFDAPTRAEDAALVPMSFSAQTASRRPARSRQADAGH